VGDYAGCAGDNEAFETSGDRATPPRGAIVRAVIPWRYTRSTPPQILGQQISETRFGNIVDGVSNTIFFGEKHVRLGRFGNSTSNNDGDASIYNGDIFPNALRAAGSSRLIAIAPTSSFNNQFGSYHPGICQFAMGDGSVRQLPISTPGTVLDLLALRDDGMPIPDF
jgi:hypothetical protein